MFRSCCVMGMESLNKRRITVGIIDGGYVYFFFNDTATTEIYTE